MVSGGLYTVSMMISEDMEKVSYFLRHGATHSSQSGKGPAIFAIFAERVIALLLLSPFSMGILLLVVTE